MDHETWETIKLFAYIIFCGIAMVAVVFSVLIVNAAGKASFNKGYFKLSTAIQVTGYIGIGANFLICPVLEKNGLLYIEFILSIISKSLMAASFIMIFIMIFMKDKNNSVGSKVNLRTDILLCLFLGIFGAHKFYEGKIGKGIIYALTLGYLGVGVMADLTKLFNGHVVDVRGEPVLAWNKGLEEKESKFDQVY